VNGLDDENLGNLHETRWVLREAVEPV
jgi:hypothetical protein